MDKRKEIRIENVSDPIEVTIIDEIGSEIASCKGFVKNYSSKGLGVDLDLSDEVEIDKNFLTLFEYQGKSLKALIIWNKKKAKNKRKCGLHITNRIVLEVV